MLFTNVVILSHASATRPDHPGHTLANTTHPTVTPLFRQVRNNFILGTYNTLYNIDTDDGSGYLQAHNNFFVQVAGLHLLPSSSRWTQQADGFRLWMSACTESTEGTNLPPLPPFCWMMEDACGCGLGRQYRKSSDSDTPVATTPIPPRKENHIDEEGGCQLVCSLLTVCTGCAPFAGTAAAG